MNNCKNTHKCFELCYHYLCDEIKLGHWLLYDALTTSISLPLILTVEMGKLLMFLML